jgi:hypothetical protein
MVLRDPCSARLVAGRYCRTRVLALDMLRVFYTVALRFCVRPWDHLPVPSRLVHAREVCVQVSVRVASFIVAAAV